MIDDQSARARCHDAALRFLANRPRSEREVRDRLRRGDFEVSVIDATIARLRHLRLVDDAQFSAYWIENRQRFRPRGARALRAELAQKGVDAVTVEATLVAGDEEPVEAATRAARQYARRLSTADEATRQRRLGQFLARRGFDWETVQAALNTLAHELRLESDDVGIGSTESRLA
jgi:regulatory protein